MIARRSLIAAGIVAVATMLLQAQSPNDVPPADALTRLGQQLERGDATLEYRDRGGFLPSLLEHLHVNVDSQTLVFSKTSFQQAIINPKNPRALYFNDEVAVGTVPGGDVYELLALEPNRGMVFYTLDVKQTDQPRFRRRGVECLFCHAMGNKGAPSLVVASVFPDKDGIPAYQHLHQHHRSSDAVRAAVGRLVRHGHARVPAAHGQRDRRGSSPSS